MLIACLNPAATACDPAQTTVAAINAISDFAQHRLSPPSELESNATDTGKVSEAGRLSWECLA